MKYFLLLAIASWALTAAAADPQPAKPDPRAFLAAVGAGNIASVKALLDQGADPNQAEWWTNNSSYQPLGLASELGNLEMMQLLLDRGAKVDGNANPKNTSLRPPLAYAAKARQLKAVQLLLAAHASVNLMSYYSAPAFWFASENADLDMMKALVAAGADINLPNQYNYDHLGFCSPDPRFCEPTSPLAEAIRLQHREVIDYLLSLKADPTSGPAGYQPLTFAVMNKDLGLIQRLVAAGAELSYKSQYGVCGDSWQQRYLPLNVAVQAGDLELVRTLLAVKNAVKVINCTAPDDRSDSNPWETPLLNATRHQRIDIIEALLGAGAGASVPEKPDQYSPRQPLHVAVASGCLECARLLLRGGAAPDTLNNDGYSALHLAAARNDVPMARLLLLSGANVNVKDTTTGYHYGKDAACEPVCNGSALSRAAYYGFLDLARLLLDAGADPNVADLQPNDRGYGTSQDARGTPALWAAHGGFVELLELLLKKGAKATAVDSDSNTALFFALDGPADHFLQITTLLTMAGVNIDATNAYGFTALHALFMGQTPRSGSVDKTKVLLMMHAHPDLRSVKGSTPLLYAAGYFGNEYPDAIRALAQAGADLDAKNAVGLTPVDVALAGGFTKTKELLCSLGSKHPACKK